MEHNLNSIDVESLLSSGGQNQRSWVLVITGFGCVANYLAVTGIEYIYLSIASLLNNTLPIFIIIVAYFMLGERMNSIQTVAIAFALGGVVLMSLNALGKETQNEAKGLPA
jgi:drug/metabolite transporter (DMT)-like permease